MFMLSRNGDTWTSTVLYAFHGSGNDVPEPSANLSFDTSGNLYGTTTFGGSADVGMIFKLTHGAGGWSFTPLKNFASDCHDGCLPFSDVIFDAHGNLYGTTAKGGAHLQGTVWKITP